MLKKRFFNKADAEKPKNDAPDSSETDIEVETEEVMEEATDLETESEVDEISELAESVDLEEIAEESEDNTAALKKEAMQLQDKYLRLAAEYDNYRKRTMREKTELIKTAGESLLIDILPLVDDFERGVEAASVAEDMEAVRTGMGLIYSKLKEFLANHGVTEIKAINEPFDTDWHEAITNIPVTSDDMKGKIVDVIQKGYTLNNKVIRYPKVVVGE